MSEAIEAGPERGVGTSLAGALTFWQMMAFGIAGIAVVGFGQFALRGYVDVATVPLWVHLHGVAMLAWLGLFALQPWLANSGSFELHRRLGWFGAGLAVFVFFMALATAILAMKLDRVVPFQTDGYFLSMNGVSLVTFAVLFGSAIAYRRNLPVHQRLMITATLMLIDPGIARMLPAPYLLLWTEPVVMLIQLAVLSIVLRHDYRTLGRPHGATIASMLAIVIAHILIEVLGRAPFMLSLGEVIARTS